MAKTFPIKCYCIWPAVAVLIALAWVAGCNRGTSDIEKGYTVKALANYDVNQFLLTQLKRNRVLFVGDCGHQNYLYKRTVYDLLKYWISQIENGTDSIPRRLYLVLEVDSVEANQIRSSVGNFDAGVWLNKSRPGRTDYRTGDLQFLYHDVGEIFKSVATYNGGHQDNSIFFDIVGPERVIDLNDWSIARRDSFFVYERDDYSSARIIDLLEQNPDYRTVIFYGAAHMQRGEQLKRTRRIQNTGYYLGHYLAERFENDGGVYGVFQTSVSGEFTRVHKFMSSPGKTYAIDNSTLAKEWFTSASGGPGWIGRCDGSIIHFDPAVVDPQLKSILSLRIVDNLLGQIKKYENSENDFFRSYWRTADRRLRLVSAINTKRSGALPYSDWARWYGSASPDMVDSISTLRLWNRLIDSMEVADIETAHWYDSLLSLSLRIVTFKDTTKTLSEKVRAYRDRLKSHGDVIIIENLVNLLLVGTDEEIARALPILRDSTAQNFDTPWEWADWLRGSRLAEHPF